MTSKYDEAGADRPSGHNEDELDVPAWVGSKPGASGNAAAGTDAAGTHAAGTAAAGTDAAGTDAAGTDAGTVSRRGPRPAPASDPVRGPRPVRSRPAANEAPEAVTDDGYSPFIDFDDQHGEYVRLPRRPGRLRRMVLAMGVVAVIALIAVAAGGWWVLRQIDPPGPRGPAITITIPEGASLGGIAVLLHKQGVIGNDRIFKEYVRFKGEGADGRFQAGRYTFTRHSSMAEALAALRKGPVPTAYAQVTFPEGLTLTEIADRLTKGVNWLAPDRVQAAFGSVRSSYQPADSTTLEGLIFPDTYRFAEGTNEQDAIGKMVGQFEQVAKEVQLDEGAAKLGYTPYQIVTIASLIEREARVPEDRGKIARVIYNRLGADMRLDIDASTAYAVHANGRALTQADLDVDSPYNTRRYKGIPPSPIAAPGRASLEAALHPTDGDWLYYVLASADGHHYFTNNLSDFNRAVAKASADGLLG